MPMSASSESLVGVFCGKIDKRAKVTSEHERGIRNYGSVLMFDLVSFELLMRNFLYIQPTKRDSHSVSDVDLKNTLVITDTQLSFPMKCLTEIYVRIDIMQRASQIIYNAMENSVAIGGIRQNGRRLRIHRFFFSEIPFP
jgi:hypothetical protein